MWRVFLVMCLVWGVVSSGGTALASEKKDAPNGAIPLRGIVEGFYGTPWSQADRLDMLEFCEQQGFNAYIYAPKDDAYHRDQWKEPYPEAELSELSSLVRSAREHGVHFIFAVSPGLDIHFSGVESVVDKIAMIKKLNAMYELGVRDFAIFFDDIEDKNGRGQAEFLNWLDDNFIREHPDVSPLITVPTEYFREDMQADGKVKQYTADFSSTLNDDILVLYTGEKVVSDGLTDEELGAAESLYGRSLGIWWNYPVSDYLESKLALGPMEKLPRKTVPAIFFNPMKHAELSKIALATGADYSRIPQKYDAQSAWEKAISEQYGNLAEDMLAFADQSQHMEVSWGKIGRPDGERMTRAIELYLSDPTDETERENLQGQLTALQASVHRLQNELPPKALAECKPQLEQLSRIIEADLLGMELLQDESLSQVKREAFEKKVSDVKQHGKEAKIADTSAKWLLDELIKRI